MPAIHWVDIPDAPVRAPPGWSSTEGPLPEGPVDVLVGGRPDRQALDRCTDVLVVPYAGLPLRTRRFLLERPELRVYALHHNADAVAEMALALLLAAARDLVPIDRTFRTHDWTPRYAPDRSVALRGRRAVVLGGGAIGSRLRPMLEALGMEVVLVRRTAPPTLADLDGLLPTAQVLVGALPSTPDTQGALDARRLALLPDDAVLVNVGRADLADESALFEALQTGRIRAGLDVWYRYPRGDDVTDTPPSAHPFHALDNVVMSPHRAAHGPGIEALRSRQLEALLQALADGREPAGRVDVEAGY